MKLTRQEWLKLRVPLIIFALALIFITVFVSVAENHKNVVKSGLGAQKNQLAQAQQKYRTSGHEKETIVKYLPLYQALVNDGFIGEERRIEWVDSLRTIHQKNKFFKINYSIASQEDYKPTFPLNAGTFKPKHSLMKLELSMLHEGDLLTLINALDAEETTPFILRDCELTRLVQSIPNTFSPNMQAKCELDWLTMHEPQESKP
ncbi:hypothetical protein A7981_10360 [Methylovorus sp. MM2]|uniref:hypothetical protein n=1 Tax=Methylovorus sp. MM2 TaxID=1848038 RepID=UPI0007DEF5DE|nr:hypothetical protein [Methylovorus sp. MM2]OAM51848.1 hypothetical protein A7981_10360 [Methylovorus sp. MM2]